MKIAVLALSVGLLFGSAALAQFRVDVALVELIATVTDESGRYVSGLKPDDFIVEEDGVPQTVAQVSLSSDLPVTVGILLDVSASMQQKLPTATAAIDRFIRMVHKDDDIFLLTFSNTATLQQDFTDDRAKLAEALRRVRLGRDTALYDALDDGLSHIKLGLYKKRAILLVTDGEESGASGDTYKEVLANVRENEVLVYGLGIAPSSPPPVIDRGPINPQLQPPSIPSPGQRGTPRGGRGWLAQGSSGGRNPSNDSVNMTALNAFADASGGKAWLVHDSASEMDRILEIIANDLRNQYNLGYYSSRAGRDNKWRRVVIRTKNPRYIVRARKDYFAG